MPLQIVRASDRSGRPYYVIAVDEFAAPLGPSTPHTRIPISKLGACIAALKRNACTHVVFTGKLQRPDGGRVRLRPDWAGLVFLITNLGVLGRENDSIHRAIARVFERHGLKVVSPLDVAPELVARAGCFTRTQPTETVKTSFPKALRLAKAHGATKLGQAVVMQGDAVIAREARAGTDAMIAELTGVSGTGAFLVKAMAPNQLSTIDPPAIGDSTVTIAAAAGLDGILVEANRSIVVDIDRVREHADELGLFVCAAVAEDA